MINEEDFPFLIETQQWTDELTDLEDFSFKILKVTESFLSSDKVDNYEYAVVFTDDKQIQELNKNYRNIDKPTNVLSFENIPGSNGDIILAYQTIYTESKVENKPFKAHLAHLLVHGRLHLAGYDHLNDDDAEVMERLESEIMMKIGFPDPWKNTSPTLT